MSKSRRLVDGHSRNKCNMTLWIEAIVAVACSYAVALGIWPILVCLPEPWIRRVSLVALAIIPYTGLVVGPNPDSYEAKCARLLIAILGSALGAVSYLYWRRAWRRGFADYARFLWVAMVNPHRLISGNAVSSAPPVPLWPEVLRAAAAAIAIAFVWIAVQSLLQYGVIQSQWLANYLVVVAALVLMATALGQFTWALGRMTGYRGAPYIDRVWLARTPAEFWRRWNWLVHWLFYRYVYLPSGGRRRAIWATLAVFLVSGLGHELLTGAGLGRMTGHQTAFFMLSGLGVIASPQLERLSRWGVPGEVVMRLATVAFMLATATLMFATLNYFVPLFPQPAWLAW